jgi:hypothetical protein
MIHVFLLIVLINGEIDSEDMYFVDINRCNYFVQQIVSGKKRNTGYNPPGVKLEAYCVPRLVDSTDENNKIYTELQ